MFWQGHLTWMPPKYCDARIFAHPRRRMQKAQYEMPQRSRKAETQPQPPMTSKKPNQNCFQHQSDWQHPSRNGNTAAAIMAATPQ